MGRERGEGRGEMASAGTGLYEIRAPRNYDSPPSPIGLSSLTGWQIKSTNIGTLCTPSFNAALSSSVFSVRENRADRIRPEE